MAKYELTNKAVEDLSRIWEYTFENWSSKQADKYYKLLLSSCKYLANNPEVGKRYESIKRDLLGFKTKRHIIFYRKRFKQPIEITRILHVKMDLKNRIKE